jgi:hypothetical protein
MVNFIAHDEPTKVCAKTLVLISLWKRKRFGFPIYMSLDMQCSKPLQTRKRFLLSWRIPITFSAVLVFLQLDFCCCMEKEKAASQLAIIYIIIMNYFETEITRYNLKILKHD